jgi:hypothetical protein
MSGFGISFSLRQDKKKSKTSYKIGASNTNVLHCVERFLSARERIINIDGDERMWQTENKLDNYELIDYRLE